MAFVYLLLLLAGLVCFAIGTFAQPQRINIVSLGLAFWILVPLLTQIQAV